LITSKEKKASTILQFFFEKFYLRKFELNECSKEGKNARK